MSEKPIPGSDEAIAAGCKCPVMDNNHGRFAPWPPDGYFISGDCPVHAPLPENDPPLEDLAPPPPLPPTEPPPAPS